LLWFGVRGVQYGNAGVGPKLAPKERGACISLSLGRGSITARDVRPDQELLSVLVERVGGDEPTRKLHRPGSAARRELCPRGLPEHAVGRSGQVSPAREQPRLETGARGKGLALQEFSTNARDVDRLDPGARCQRMNVYE
jgi:hypothetical protein